MQLQLVVLAAIVATCHSSHSSCRWNLRDPCASAATQTHDADIAIPVVPGHPNSPDAGESREKRAATSDTSRLWPGAIVYYTMSGSFSSSHQQLIYSAMRQWESHTCIRFHQRTTQHSYINFFPGSGCCSYVGMYNCGQQGVSLASNCISMLNALHEIGHAVGFWHEQNRPDRDEYVNVLFNNVRDGYEHNFEKRPPSEINSLGVRYDYNSIMHYHGNSWSKSRNLDTIQSKIPGIQIGASDRLSPLDIEQTNLLYRCDQENPSPLPTVIPSLPTPPTESFPCGDTIVAPSGSFHSPGYYDFDYRTNQDCTWVLNGTENHRLTITFNMIRMEDSPGCSKDYLEVTLPETLNTQAFKFRRICKQETSYNLYASGNVATVYYHTDGNNRGTNLRGFEAVFQSVDFDECANSGINPCDHECHNTPGSFTCSCRDGWYIDAGGTRCFDMNECALGNGGCEHKCVNSAGSFRCECNPGFVLLTDGESCEEENGCHNGNGDCEQLCFDSSSPSGTPTCGCREGYQLAADGVHCLDIDECTEGSHSCQHNCSNLHGSYFCSCRAGYQLNRNGRTCNNIHECVLGRHQCTHSCRDTNGSYECGCPNGLRLANNNHACRDVDECREGTALCSDGCLNMYGTYRCFCPSGYHVDTDGVTCVDHNECFRSSTNACNQQSGAVCVNTEGSYECACHTGFQLESSGHSCQDLNECSLGSDECGESIACRNTVGSYECTCADGYHISVDGKSSCEDVNECADDSHSCSHICENNPGSYTCSCHSGYQISSNEVNCQDIDECEEGTAQCSHGCRNTIGSYQCFCSLGYDIGADGATCIDLDECFHSFTNACDQQSGAICVNSVGSYECTCHSGYLLESSGFSCQDIDECALGTDECGEGMVCRNTVGSYKCTCPDGYHISTDVNTTCQDVDECTDGSHRCSHICENTRGSYTCSCHGGYQISIDGISCEDVNECVAEIDGCGEDVLCQNTIGSYLCTCMEGYGISGDGRSACEDVDECTNGSHNCRHICQNTLGSYTCSCHSGYQISANGFDCEDVNECAVNNGGCAHSCTNVVGGYQCRCYPGYQRINKTECAARSCEFRNGDCVHECFNDVDGNARCKCKPGYIQHRVYGQRCFAFDDPRSSKGDCGLPCEDVCVREGDSFRCDCSEVGKFLQSDGISCRTTQLITQAPTTKPFVQAPTTKLTAHTPKAEQPTTQYIAIQPTTHVPSIMPTTKVDIVQPASQVPTPQPTTQPLMIQLTATQRTPASIQSTAQASFLQPTTQVPAIQPTTQAPTTTQPITPHPSTQPNPTTQPTTEAPTTQLMTEMPTTQSTTKAPTTQPTPEAPTTQPTTEMPTTQSTTEAPTTQPTTEAPTTRPTTEVPTTRPTTEIPTQPMSEMPTQPTAEMPATQSMTEMPTTQPTTEMSTTQPTIQTEPTPMIDCVRDITASAGVIQSPNWPETYPSSIHCEWTITVPDANGAVQLTFDPMYGIEGVPPSCEEDWLEILNGLGENTVPQNRSCGNISPSKLILSINTAKVVFTSGPQHDSNHRGFRINFHALERPLGTFSCGQFIRINQYFGPPDFPHLIGHTVSLSTNVKCTWRCLATIGTKLKLRLLYFDLPESEGCSQNSLKIYDGLFERNTKVANLCGSPTKHVYHVSGAYMTVVLETTTPGTFRGFHAVCEG